MKPQVIDIINIYIVPMIGMIYICRLVIYILFTLYEDNYTQGYTLQ